MWFWSPLRPPGIHVGSSSSSSPLMGLHVLVLALALLCQGRIVSSLFVGSMKKKMMMVKFPTLPPHPPAPSSPRLEGP